MKPGFISSILFSLLTLSSFVVSAVPTPVIKTTAGHVGAVGVVTDAEGNPILAEFGSDGLIVSELGAQGVGRFEDVDVMSAVAYRALQDILKTFKEQHGENGDRLAVGARLMSAEQYKSFQFKTNTPEKTPVNKPDLKDPNSKSVLVIDERRILTASPSYEAMILMEFPVDLSQDEKLSDSTLSLLINGEGKIVYKSDFDISFKVEFYKDKNAVNGFDKLWAPIGSMPIDGIYGGAPSFPDGKYVLTEIWPSCPGTAYFYSYNLTAKIYYSSFNPKNRNAGGGHYVPILKRAFVACLGLSEAIPPTSLGGAMTKVALSSIESGINLGGFSAFGQDFVIPVMRVESFGSVPDVEIAGVTEYRSDDTPLPLQGLKQYNFDFDNDGKQDTAVVNPSDANVLDIYLGGRPPLDQKKRRNPPDLTRRVDTALQAQLQDQGLLKTVTVADMEDTDVYVYRVSTGQLLTTVEGLSGGAINRDNDVFFGDGGGVSPTSVVPSFSFTSLVFGAGIDAAPDLSLASLFGVENLDRRPWSPSQTGSSGFPEKKPDFMRVGELIRLVAINRPTGYIGTKTIRLQALFDEIDQSASGANDFILRPPNLKIVATRDFEERHGGNQGEKHVNIIGSEGAGLTSDNLIKIQTIWLDHDGNPLPDDLPGYTGRVAISKGNSSEDFSGNFEIRPGYQTQVVQLNNAAELTTEHFYVQVIGENFDGNPSFASPGAGAGKLQTRPAKYVPIKVPLFNELETRDAQNALNQARSAGQPNLPDQVAPVYHWVYRPEMQFSVYDLSTQQLLFENKDGNTQLIDLTGQSQEDVLGLLLDEELNFVDLLYDLSGPNNDPLARFSGDAQLVFSIGAEEELATVTLGGSARFENPDHIAQLDSADLFAIRLYQNNDSYNVLWQYTLPGVYAFYKLPHVERLLKKTKDSALDDKEFHILGGTRTRFEYFPEPDEGDITNYEWSFTPAGAFKKDFRHDATAPANTNSGTVYWEPNEWKEDHDITGKLIITLSDGETRTKNFKVTTRVLEPKPTLMEGSDVAMLEELLWQLGLSPQKDSYGTSGARIASNRSRLAVGPINTQSCKDGLAEHRDVYYRGKLNECKKGEVSTELMVNRFQGRSLGKAGKNAWNNHQTGNGKVDNQMLTWLKDDWLAYHTSYDEFSGQNRIDKTHSSIGKWLDSAVDIWSNGLGTDVPITYTQAKHEGILESIGLAKSAFTRQTFLSVWSLRESTGHWGSGSNHRTDYRLEEGGADPFGSLSFSQLLYRYRYSDKPSVIHKAVGKNLYHPKENLETFVIHTAKNNDPIKPNHTRVDAGGINRAFVPGSTLAEKIPADLKGYMKKSKVETLAANSKEGDYELLAKGVGIYNGATSWLRADSWPFILKTYKITPAKVFFNQGKKATPKNQRKCYSCKYSIEVRSNAGFGFRTYVWQGGLGFDVNGDGKIQDVPANPTAVPPVAAITETTTPWCFKYGEKEWLDGKLFETVKNKARGNALKAPVGRIACK